MRRKSEWSGDVVRRARARISARGWPQPCCRCGRMVQPHERWQVDHYPISREQGKALGIPLDTLPTAPAHARCNESAGGKRGAQITNAKHSKNHRPHRHRGSDYARGIRGVE